MERGVVSPGDGLESMAPVCGIIVVSGRFIVVIASVIAWTTP